jgi:FkbH-like protein
MKYPQMKYFIFRNNTVEPFFDTKCTEFSGYDDISFVPRDVPTYIWFYQLPVGSNINMIARETDSYLEKLNLVLSKIPESSSFVIFTLEDLYSVPLTTDNFELRRAISRFNNSVEDLAQKDDRIKVIDFSDFTRRYSASQLISWKYYFLSQTLINPKLRKDFKTWWKRREEEIAFKRKKCIVLDLDNTLWGGVLGEDGIDGIKLGGDYPGKAFTYWQSALLQLANTGIILTICSKNNEEDVFEAWEKNPFMVLKKEHFSAYRINWNDKASNIKDLAKELNIGLDSMVFIDDNPSERELVKQMLPMVSVPDFPEKPYGLMSFFKDITLQYFRIYSVTDEDRRKTEQYKANAKRKIELAKYANFEDYLCSLNIEISVNLANRFNIPRIAQMTQKTNQFNLTTHRYTEADIHKMIEAKYMICCIGVKDRFGDNGITGVIFLKPISDVEMDIDSLLLSCRILGKGIETAFVYTIFNILIDKKVNRVSASYVPTKKNKQVADFYDRIGMTCTANKGEIKNYRLELNHKFEINDLYNIKIDFLNGNE